MAAVTKFFITIENERVVAKYEGVGGGGIVRSFDSSDDLEAFFAAKASEACVPVDALEVSCSSAIDFPREFTSNPVTIALAESL